MLIVRPALIGMRLLTPTVRRRAKNPEINAFDSRRHVTDLLFSGSSTAPVTACMCFRNAWSHSWKSSDVVAIVAPPFPLVRSGPQCAAHSQSSRTHFSLSNCSLRASNPCAVVSNGPEKMIEFVHTPESPCRCAVVATQSRALSPAGAEDVGRELHRHITHNPPL